MRILRYFLVAFLLCEVVHGSTLELSTWMSPVSHYRVGFWSVAVMVVVPCLKVPRRFRPGPISGSIRLANVTWRSPRETPPCE